LNGAAQRTCAGGTTLSRPPRLETENYFRPRQLEISNLKQQIINNF
jgi:hypothetical protein